MYFLKGCILTSQIRKCFGKEVQNALKYMIRILTQFEGTKQTLSLAVIKMNPEREEQHTFCSKVANYLYLKCCSSLS